MKKIGLLLCALFILPLNLFALNSSESGVQTFEEFSSLYDKGVLENFGLSVSPAELLKNAAVGGVLSSAPSFPKSGFFDAPDYSFAYNNELTVKIIDAVKKTADIMLYSINLNEMKDAIVNAKKRGAKVRMIIDQFHVYPRMSPQIKALIKEGIEIRTLRGERSYGVMHNKIGIYDNKLLTTGSYNWTFGATFYNSENMLMVRHPLYVKGYAKYFNWTWKNANTLEQGPQNEVPQGYYGKPPQDNNPRIDFNSIKVPAYIFSPGSNAEEKLAAIIAKARKSVDVVTFTFSSKILADAVIAANNRGIKVRFMIDKKTGKESWAARKIFSNGVPLRWRRGRTDKGAMHNKFAILDGKLLETGSFNFTINASKNSFENMIFTDDASVINAYQEIFDGFYLNSEIPSPEDFTAE